MVKKKVDVLVNEAPVKEVKTIVKSKFPVAEMVQDNGKEQIILEGSANWFRMVKRIKRKKDTILLVDGNTSHARFKGDCESYLANLEF